MHEDSYLRMTCSPLCQASALGTRRIGTEPFAFEVQSWSDNFDNRLSLDEEKNWSSKII